MRKRFAENHCFTMEDIFLYDDNDDDENTMRYFNFLKVNCNHTEFAPL